MEERKKNRMEEGIREGSGYLVGGPALEGVEDEEAGEEMGESGARGGVGAGGAVAAAQLTERSKLEIPPIGLTRHRARGHTEPEGDEG